MTAEEVKNKLTLYIVSQARGNGKLYINGVVKVIFDALEKQIPKKPIIHRVREDITVNTISYTCPVCNERIGITEDYCKQCGQALDWSEEE